jgi:hypothetical protein
MQFDALRSSAAPAAIVLLVALSAAAARGEEYGDLTGRFVYMGVVPPAGAAPAPVGGCNVARIPPQFALGPKREFKDVVVQLSLKLGEKAPAAKAADVPLPEVVELDNKNCEFVPHIVLLQTSQKLRIKNSDQIPHNAKVDSTVNPPINPLIAPGAHIDASLAKAERLPVRASCSIHPFMTGYVVVVDHPFAAVTDDEGRFTIKNVPVGKRSFRVWQESMGYVVNVVDAETKKPLNWPRGVFDIEIKPGLNDLGLIEVP